MKKHTFAKLILCVSLSLMLTLLCAIILTLSLKVTPQIADATSSNAEFTQVFPTVDYFQSTNPCKVSANSRYLIIYDNVLNKLFVRSNASVNTYSYDTNFDNVDNVFAIGDTAFLNDNGTYYTLNLSDNNSTWTQRTLTIPADINFFNTDGTHLYAHSTTGAVCVYDENLDIAFDTQNLREDEFAGLGAVVMGENDYLYVFSIATGTPFFMTYNVATKEKSDRIYINNNSLVAEAYVGDVIYALKAFDGVKRIVGIDKNNVTELFSTTISPDAFFAYGDKLFTIENNAVTVYTLNSDKSGLTRNATVTMSGSDDGHFDNPTDIVKNDDNLAVVDSNNNRLQIVNSSTVQSVKFDETPLRVTNKGNDYYVTFANCVRKISDGNVLATYQIQNVVDATYHDKLYVLTTDGVYTVLGNNVVKLCSSYNAKRIACAKNGTNIYLLTDNEIVTISPSGEKLPSLATDDFSSAIDFAIDYEGKITVSYKDSFAQYLGENNDSFTLVSNTLKANVSSIYLDGTSLYFTAKECFVGKTSISAHTIDTYTYTTPQIGKDTTISFANPKDNALYFSADGRVENTSYANAQTVLVYDDIMVDDSGNYRYARVGATLVKIAINDFESVQPTQLTGDYVTNTATALYVSPYCEDGKISVEQGTMLTLVHDTCGYDKGAWVAVKYEDNDYYVKTNHIEEYVVVVPEEDKVYGKANADRVGGIVNVYASQSTSSEIIAEIIDGQKVEVLETLDDFYMVSIDGIIGYVEKDNIKIDGLTTVQVVAIVLAIVVALAGTAIFASIYLTRKKTDEKKKEEKVQKRF